MAPSVVAALESSAATACAGETITLTASARLEEPTGALLRATLRLEESTDGGRT